MSVLIKGMEMPKYGCDDCFLRTGNYCGRIEKSESVVEYARNSERHPDCPLVPVLLHGRLIDADEFFKALTTDDRFSILEAMYIQKILSDAPTIILADCEPNIDEAMAEFAQYCEMYEPMYDPDTGAM